jgi:hypothetical protein
LGEPSQRVRIEPRCARHKNLDLGLGIREAYALWVSQLITDLLRAVGFDDAVYNFHDVAVAVK